MSETNDPLHAWEAAEAAYSTEVGRYFVIGDPRDGIGSPELVFDDAGAAEIKRLRRVADDAYEDFVRAARPD